MTDICQISPKRFNALFYSFFHPLDGIGTIIDCYELFDGKLLGIVFMDNYDRDFSFCIFGRDARNLFRGISIGNFYPTPSEAFNEMQEEMELYRNDGQTNYPQGDEDTPPNHIFEPQIPANKFHSYFKALLNEERYEPARHIITEIAYAHVDVDNGHYIKDFQGPGFEARLWELYLYRYFYETHFDMITDYHAPDYLLEKFDHKIAVEAVTIGPATPADYELVRDLSEAEIENDYLPIRYGSPLYSKLNHTCHQKHYWELDHVQGNPLIFAIHDYHFQATKENFGSMTYSWHALYEYLYGLHAELNDDGEVFFSKIEHHICGKKSIPSGFFFTKNAENISAVLFGNQATISKFQRMGTLAGWGKDNQSYRITRERLNADGNIYLDYSKLSAPTYEESWADGIIMYHNPNAINPLNPSLFPNISHVSFDPETSKPIEQFLPGHIFSVSCLVTNIRD